MAEQMEDQHCRASIIGPQEAGDRRSHSLHLPGVQVSEMTFTVDMRDELKDEDM